MKSNCKCNNLRQAGGTEGVKSPNTKSAKASGLKLPEGERSFKSTPTTKPIKYTGLARQQSQSQCDC